MIDKVICFNKTRLGIGQRDPKILESKEFDWLINALKEEIDELNAANQVHDFVGYVDALVDLIYFAIGGLYRSGLTANQIYEVFAVVHEANMTKHGGIKKTRKIQHELDAVKPTNWKGPEEAIKIILGE